MTLVVPLDDEQLARLVALKTGKTPDAVVREAIEARAAESGVETKPRRTFDETKVRAVIQRVSMRPIFDTRSEDDILGFQDNGVPVTR